MLEKLFKNISTDGEVM